MWGISWKKWGGIYKLGNHPIFIILNAEPFHPYNWLLSLCYSICQIYSEVKRGNIYAYYEQLISVNDTVQIVNNSINKCKTAEDWINLFDYNGNSKSLSENDFDDILKPFQEKVISTCQHIRNIFFEQSYFW